MVARTGLRDDEARLAGYAPITVEVSTWDHTPYYPDADEVRIRLTGDLKTGRLLGAQMIGRVNTEIAKRIDVFATALFHGMLITDLSSLDLSYTPPLSSPWDPIQVSAQVWVTHQLQGNEVTRPPCFRRRPLGRSICLEPFTIIALFISA